jgi:hypothetical protein
MTTTNKSYREGRGGRADGKAKIGSLVALLVVIGGVYMGMKFIPVRAAAYAFDDEVREQVVFAGARRRQIGNEEIMRNLMAKADELGLPIRRSNVRITRRTNRIRIQAAWKSTVELPFDFTYDWTFVADHEGPSF